MSGSTVKEFYVVLKNTLRKTTYKGKSVLRSWRLEIILQIKWKNTVYERANCNLLE